MTEEDEEFNRIERESAMRQESVRSTMLAKQPAQKRPQNCGTGYCSCIECVMEPAQYSDIVSDGGMDPRNKFDKPAQQEPIATLWQHSETGRTRITMPGDITDCDARWFKAADLYTSPPVQRTWVGLTHEEHMEIMTGTMTTSSRMAAVEAKLKEKNT